MTLDLSPAPGASPRARLVGNHARVEATMLLRNGEQLLLALVIPVALLVGGHLAADRIGVDRTQLPASVLALAIFSSAFTSLAIATAFERRYGVLERLAATPLGRAGLLEGKAIAVTLVCLGQAAVLGAIALALGWRPHLEPLPTLLALAVAVVAAFAFANFGLLLAGRLRAEAVLGLANLLYVGLAAAGALVLPLSTYPTAVRPALALLPTAALGEALRAAARGDLVWWPLPVVAVWAVLFALLTRKVFRWLS